MEVGAGGCGGGGGSYLKTDSDWELTARNTESLAHGTSLPFLLGVASSPV